MSKGAVIAMTYSVARDYLAQTFVATAFRQPECTRRLWMTIWRTTYPGSEKEMFEKLAKSQPIGRMADPAEVASLAYFYARMKQHSSPGWIIRLDGGFCNLRG